MLVFKFGARNFFGACSPEIRVQNFSRKSSLASDKQRITTEEIMRHLFQEYKTGKDNTQLLSDALAYATPEQLEVEITRVCS
jgi:exonuclease I